MISLYHCITHLYIERGIISYSKCLPLLVYHLNYSYLHKIPPQNQIKSPLSCNLCLQQTFQYDMYPYTKDHSVDTVGGQVANFSCFHQFYFGHDRVEELTFHGLLTFSNVFCQIYFPLHSHDRILMTHIVCILFPFCIL